MDRSVSQVKDEKEEEPQDKYDKSYEALKTENDELKQAFDSYRAQVD